MPRLHHEYLERLARENEQMILEQRLRQNATKHGLEEEIASLSDPELGDGWSRRTAEDFVNHGGRSSGGIIAAYKEQQNPHALGIDPRKLRDRKGGRKRRKPPKAAAWRAPWED